MFNLKFETKKDLRRKIDELRYTINQTNMIIDIRERNGLKKCVGLVCKGCEHVVTYRDSYGEEFFIGCDVEVNCPDYKRKTLLPTNAQ